MHYTYQESCDPTKKKFKRISKKHLKYCKKHEILKKQIFLGQA